MFMVRQLLALHRLNHLPTPKSRIKSIGYIFVFKHNLPMLIFWTFILGAVLGYIYGHRIKPNLRLRKALSLARETCQTALREGNKGVYRTIVTEEHQSSELTVEVQELAVTQAGQVKVAYVSAFYKNPSFRTRKGEALLREVRELLGDYLPQDEIEWYNDTARKTHIKEQLNTLDNLHNHHFGA